MNQGKYVFAQLMSLLDANEFRRCVNRYQGDHRVRQFTCWHQFLCLSFGQLTHRASLRDIVICLQAHESKLYHFGLSYGVSRSTLAEANERRDWRIYADLAQGLIQRAQTLYAGGHLEGLDFENTVYALDSTTIDLCLEVFWWAKFRKHKAAVKLHTLFDIRCQVPCFVHITDGLLHDVNVLDLLTFERDAFYVMDRGYLDWARLSHIQQAGAFFVIRAKKNLAFTRVYSHTVDKSNGLRCDQIIRLANYQAALAYSDFNKHRQMQESGVPDLKDISFSYTIKEARVYNDVEYAAGNGAAAEFVDFKPDDTSVDYMKNKYGRNANEDMLNAIKYTIMAYDFSKNGIGTDYSNGAIGCHGEDLLTGDSEEYTKWRNDILFINTEHAQFGFEKLPGAKNANLHSKMQYESSLVVKGSTGRSSIFYKTSPRGWVMFPQTGGASSRYFPEKKDKKS